MADKQCPLNPSKTFTSMKWTFEDVKAIENHIKTANSCSHPPLQDLVVTGLQEHHRSTPLLMACCNGDLKAVQRIVEGWGVNVCTAGVYPMGRQLMEGVTPLFGAAMGCHSEAVRYLVEKGANVSSKTHSTDKEFSGATPLHAAVYNVQDFNCEEKISIIRFLLESGADPSVLTQDEHPIWLPIDSCGAKIITLLVKWGMDLGLRCPVSGITLLHFWAGHFNTIQEDESLEVVKMLIEKDADLQARDNYGVSVILMAAIGDDKLPNLPVLDFLLERDDIARQDKIEALEMAGAVLLGHDENHEKFPLAFQHWRRALTLRLMDTEGCHPICKTPVKSESGQLSEWATMDDLQQIELQLPSQREIQSLLVRHRIFSALSCSAYYQHFSNYFLKYLMNGVAPIRPLTQMMDICWTAMQTIFRFDPTESIGLRLRAINIINELASIILDLPEDDPSVNSETIKTLVELFVMTNQSHFTDDSLQADVDTSNMDNLCNIITILSKRPKMVTKDSKRSLKQLVRRDVRDSSGFNLLHIFCRNSDADTPSAVRFLLKLKADTNAVNNVGNSPLHLLAVVREYPEARDAVARLLLESGAHLDMANKEGMTPADLWLKKSKEKREKVDWLDLPDWLRDVPKLMCLCSRVIRRHKVPYDNDGAIIPTALIPFVSLH